MIGIDTNALVRFLVEDDAVQADRVHRFLANSRAAGERVYISVLVLCETVWVLRSAFRKSKPLVLDTVEQLLSTDVFHVEGEDAVRRAVQSCREGPGDFTDHLISHLNLTKGCTHTVTFDRALRRVPGFALL